MVFMYLNTDSFTINKNKLEIECRDNLIIVMFISKNCSTCTKNKIIFEKMYKYFPSLSFGICNIDVNQNLLKIMKDLEIPIEAVPTYALFKFGIFQRFLNIIVPDRDSIEKNLTYELTLKKPSFSRKTKYLTLSEI